MKKRVQPGLGERLKNAMKKSGYTQAKLADELGISQASVQKCTSGKGGLELNNLAQAAKFLDVSLDWLIYGNEQEEIQEVNEPGITHSNNLSALMGFSERLKIAMKNLKMTQEELAAEIGLSRGAINNVMRKKNFLEFNSAAKAAKILGVSLDWLAYGDGPAPTADVGELAILDELDAAGMKYNKQQLEYIFQLVTRLEQESQEEFYELIIHSAKSTLRAIVNRKTKEYTVTEEPNTPDADVS